MVIVDSISFLYYVLIKYYFNLVTRILEVVVLLGKMPYETGKVAHSVS